VFGHCVIVGEVAKALIRYSIPGIRKRLFPPGSELVAAVHDVGKVCPSFQKKVRKGMDDGDPHSLSGLEHADPDEEWGGHAAVSQAALKGCPKFVPEIAGKHHGYPSAVYPPDCSIFGGADWKKQRDRLIKKLKGRFDVPWPEPESTIHAAVLAGLVCTADWIGSGSAFNEIDRVEKLDRAGDLPRLAETALEAAGFVRPVLRRGLSFKDINGFEPYPLQSQFFETISAPGVYVLEAPMGMGKTEAALYGAYRVLEAGKAGGIYFALPTRLTSNRIYDRMNTFLKAVLDPDSPHRSSWLLHGSAWLRETELGEEGQPGGAWFNSLKRRILAPFGVGTVDQALMAVMNVKHGFVRTFGLAGKAVILDEVHSYDSYTGAILNELVRGLRELGCTVIILSATLTDERRRELLGGTGAALVPASAYPLVSYSRGNNKKVTEIPGESSGTAEVVVHRTDTDAAIEEALKRAEEGQQVLWIENTVAEAQALYSKLAGRGRECKVEAGLLHSRFTQTDREANENTWVGLYGAEGRARRGEQGRILVGTQVLEQSLDIDADFLVTRLCPTDMLLQRIGRLWRHRQTDPLRPRGACREVWILAADYDTVSVNYKSELGKSALVYDPYVLLRTLKVWENRSKLDLPAAIRPLVEETYREQDEDGLMETLKSELERKRGRLKRLANLGMAPGYKPLPDLDVNTRYPAPDNQQDAKTRYSELETREVLILRSAEKNTNGDISLAFTDEETLILPKGLKGKDHRAWRKCAAALSRHIVTVPEIYAPLPAPRRLLEWFKDYIYLGNEKEEDLLRIVLADEECLLRGISGTKASEKYTLSYDAEQGYHASIA
jgi:CRISPR-associated endonuclease/helicase Cas3